MRKLNQVLLMTVLTGMLWACSKPDQNPGDKYFSSGQYEEAISEYTASLKYSPNDVRNLYNRGRAYEENGDFENAKNDFVKALELDPNNFQVLLSLANLHHKEKNYTNALLYASRAEEISGAPAMASFIKARALHQMGKSEEALNSYANAIKRDKEFGQAYYNRGLLKVAMGNIGSSCEDFQLARSLEYPGSQEALDKYCK
ncbi:tetratricopeptide repeat protein [Algoriphagus machipongonensis]|uniref:TPR repeat protein n=1 Tax=Algoriphagus machipongonensis TaxID=388413 RepID=A3HT67_9BACT|nr:tetratricopeptide repeat protein [Algoriphagus machipongonensis]EAZ83035.1 TPR repeat protein [Algoriphagus machipongonensis]